MQLFQVMPLCNIKRLNAGHLIMTAYLIPLKSCLLKSESAYSRNQGTVGVSVQSESTYSRSQRTVGVSVQSESAYSRSQRTVGQRYYLFLKH